MLIKFQGLKGGTVGLDPLDVAAVFPAEVKGDVSLVGISSVFLRSSGGQGIVVKEGVDSAVDRINAVRARVFSAQKAKDSYEAAQVLRKSDLGEALNSGDGTFRP